MLDKYKNIDLIKKYQNNISYVLYNCNLNRIIDSHNIYNTYYSASIWKPIILIIYSLKYGFNSIDENDLEKILFKSNNRSYLKYAKYINKDDEDLFFKKYYGKANRFKINIVSDNYINNNDINFDEEFKQYSSLNYQEKLKIASQSNLLVTQYHRNINEKLISYENFFYSKYFDNDINTYNFNKGMINTSNQNYSKLNVLLLVRIYHDLLHIERFGNLSKKFKKYMKNIGSSILPKMDLNLDFYHKTGNHFYFSNEILYFEINKTKYMLGILSEASHVFQYGLEKYFDLPDIVLTIIRNCIIDNYKIEDKLYPKMSINFKNFQNLKKITVENQHLKIIKNKRTISRLTNIIVFRDKIFVNGIIVDSIYFLIRDYVNLHISGQKYTIDQPFKIYYDDIEKTIKIIIDFKVEDYILYRLNSLSNLDNLERKIIEINDEIIRKKLDNQIIEYDPKKINMNNQNMLIKSLIRKNMKYVIKDSVITNINLDTI